MYSTSALIKKVSLFPRSITRTSYYEDNSDTYASTTSHSQTSTLKFEHEPFETFRHRVSDLLLIIIQPQEISNAILAKVKGGSFNRMLAVTLPRKQQELILRIPRDSVTFTQVKDQVDTLNWLKDASKLHVPKVHTYDTTADSAIGDPYILMERLEGHPLSKIHDELTEKQRISLAKELAGVLHAIYTNPVPHGIGPLCFHTDGTPYLDAHQLFNEDLDAQSPLPAPISFASFAQLRFTSQRTYAQKR